MKKCSDCGILTERSSKRCRSCRDKENIRQKNQYQKRLDQSLCPRCGGNPIPGGNHCESCSTKRANRNKQRRQGRLDKSLCPQCGQRPCVLNHRLCSLCGIAANERVTLRKMRLSKQGLCIRCGGNESLASIQNRTSGNQDCLMCYLKRAAKNNLGDEKFADFLLYKLNSQGWACPYTGEKLVLGCNDSIDHIYPRSRFPNKINDQTNVEWVTRRINTTKRDQTPDEFLMLIKQIFDHRL